MSDLYGDDILLWSEQQAELLRQHRGGCRENDAIDWPNVIEEIESVGNEQLHAVESLLIQALAHMLKATAWPFWRDVPTGRLRRAVSGVRRGGGSRHPCGRGSMLPTSTKTPLSWCRTRSTVSRRCQCHRHAR